MAAVVTNKAFTETALLMTGGTATAWGSIAAGTGSQAENATDVSLVTEITANGLERAKCATASVTDSAVTGDTCLFVHTFTAASTYAVKECGIFNSLSTGDMLCYGTFATAVPMEADDTLKIKLWSARIVMFWMKVVNSVKAKYQKIYVNTEPSMGNIFSQGVRRDYVQPIQYCFG